MKYIRLLVAMTAVVMVLTQGKIFLADEWAENDVFIGFEEEIDDIVMEDDAIELQGVGNPEETDKPVDGENVDFFNEWIEDFSADVVEEEFVDEFDLLDQETFDIWEDLTEIIEDSEEYFEGTADENQLRVIITAKDRANNQGLPATFRVKDANGTWLEDASGESLWEYDGMSELVVELPGYFEEITVVQIGAETDYMIEGSAEQKKTQGTEYYYDTTGLAEVHADFVNYISETIESIQIRKEWYEGDNKRFYFADNSSTFYLALFSDAGRTNRVSPVYPLTASKNNPYKTMTIGHLAAGTYYVTETDEYGVPVIATTEISYVTYENDSSGEVVIGGTPETVHSMVIKNHYYTLPEGCQYLGMISIGKQFLLENAGSNSEPDTSFTGTVKIQLRYQNQSGTGTLSQTKNLSVTNGASDYYAFYVPLGTEGSRDVTIYEAYTKENGETAYARDGGSVLIEGSKYAVQISEPTLTLTSELVPRVTVFDTYVNDIRISTAFPDNAFREYVTQFDLDQDGFLSKEEINVVKDIDVNSADITDLSGIKVFTSLETLYCYGNELTSLDVSGLLLLRELDCLNNPLTSLNISQCTSLENVNFGADQLTSLDMSGCTALTWMNCYGHPSLTSLDASGCTGLEVLNCYQNQLTDLNVSGCTALTELRCHQNGLTTLDVSSCTGLSYLTCAENNLTSLDVSTCTSLEYLSCSDNGMQNLSVSGCTAMEYLYCRDNLLTNLDISDCGGLRTLWCYSNQLTSLNLSACMDLADLSCDDNQLTDLDISVNTALTKLYCENNNLTSLNISNAPSLMFAFRNGDHTSENGVEFYEYYVFDEEGEEDYENCRFLGYDSSITLIIPDEPPHSHIFGNWIITTPATCTTNGVKTHKCTGCGAEESETIPAEGHKQVTDPAVAATTTSEGKTEGTHCSVCGTVLKAQQTIPKIVPDTTVTPPPEAPVTVPDQITVPNKPAIKKPTATSNKITVKWTNIKTTSKKTKAVWKKIKKVQVQCATDKAFKNIVKTTTVGKNKTTATVKGLKKNMTYYVRIRYFDGTGYSKWSSAKKIKTKKK